MMPQRPAQGEEKYLGKKLRSSDGEEIGLVDRVLVHRVTGMSEWLVVEAGLMGGTKYAVPLAGSTLEDDTVVVPFNSQLLTQQPSFEADEHSLSAEDENALNQYFGLGASESGRSSNAP
jgi:hypothetical protein